MCDMVNTGRGIDRRSHLRRGDVRLYLNTVRLHLGLQTHQHQLTFYRQLDV